MKNLCCFLFAILIYEYGLSQTAESVLEIFPIDRESYEALKEITQKETYPLAPKELVKESKRIEYLEKRYVETVRGIIVDKSSNSIIHSDLCDSYDAIFDELDKLEESAKMLGEELYFISIQGAFSDEDVARIGEIEKLLTDISFRYAEISDSSYFSETEFVELVFPLTDVDRNKCLNFGYKIADDIYYKGSGANEVGLITDNKYWHDLLVHEIEDQYPQIKSRSLMSWKYDSHEKIPAEISISMKHSKYSLCKMLKSEFSYYVDFYHYFYYPNSDFIPNPLGVLEDQNQPFYKNGHLNLFDPQIRKINYVTYKFVL